MRDTNTFFKLIQRIDETLKIFPKIKAAYIQKEFAMKTVLFLQKVLCGLSIHGLEMVIDSKICDSNFIQRNAIYPVNIPLRSLLRSL